MTADSTLSVNLSPVYFAAFDMSIINLLFWAVKLSSINHSYGIEMKSRALSLNVQVLSSVEITFNYTILAVRRLSKIKL